MKILKILLLSLPLWLSGCSEPPTEQAADDAGAGSELKEQAKAWTEQTKKLGETAWQPVT